MAERSPFISYTVENDKQFNAAINSALKKVDSLKTPFKLIANDFYKSEKAIFNLKSKGQYPDFKNERSRKQKLKAVGFEYPLLYRSGKLAESVLNPQASGAILDIKDTHLIIGTNVKSKKGAPYPFYLQEGTKNMRARKFLFIGPEAKKFATSEQVGRPQRWLGFIQKYVEKHIERFGSVK